MRRLLALVLAAAAALPATAAAQDPLGPQQGLPGSFELLGHEPLMNRGMNAALAVLDGYAYVGSRTDGTHANAGVMVVDVRDPAAPAIVNEIGPPDQGMPTQTSRELRILPDQKLLLVLNHQCSELIHRCASPSSTGISVLPSAIKVYDIAGANAADPQLVATYEPSANAPQTPHEFFVWTDPKQPSRVLLYMSTPSGSDVEVTVTDFSRAREGVFPEIAGFSAGADSYTHSMTVSNDGRRMYLAQLTAGFLVADTSELATGEADPKIELLTPTENAPRWEGPGAHSAVPLPGRPDRVMITDEVYGQVPGLLANHGCPWGWVRFIKAGDPVNPAVESEYRLPANDPAVCESLTPDRNSLSSQAAHNPTLTEHLALLTWHSQGLQVIDTTDPARPAGTAEYRPEPLPVVQTEDPLLSSGRDKVVMWSFPTIVDGLVYVVDVRNGLYILRYRGPYEGEVARAKFLDGASNSGDVQRMDPVRGAVGPGAGPGAGPAAGGPPPCLAAPVRLRGPRLGPFTLRSTRERVALRGGPARRTRRAAVEYCVEGGGRMVVAFRGRRAALVATTSRRVTGARGLVPGRRAKLPRRARRLKGGYVLVRGRKSSTVAGIRGGRVRFVGVVAGRPKRAAIARLVRAARL